MKNIKFRIKDNNELVKAEALLRTLPDVILEQIDYVEFGGVGLECYLKQLLSPDEDIILPNYTTKIKIFGEYIGIYCGDFFFKLSGKFLTKPNSYWFIDCK